MGHVAERTSDAMLGSLGLNSAPYFTGPAIQRKSLKWRVFTEPSFQTEKMSLTGSPSYL